ncbi:MerR family transcriptional regulator [Vagococcus carniphilus]|uniref:MerR family transcriptional regulator n=1 Tax=Vagococcus carniphilus TaxID=218144 RepID=UPI003BAC1907
MRLYSIGEFSKASGVSIRALRYYDKKGYLKPTYINQETNYRYYSQEQFGTLTMILLCSDFDFPISRVKEFEEEDSSFDLFKLIKEMEFDIEKKQLRLSILKQSLEELEKNIIRLQEKKEIKQNYQEYFSERAFIIQEFKAEEPHYFDFTKMTNSLYDKIRTEQFITKFNRGVLKVKTNTSEKRFVFLEIFPNELSIEQQEKVIEIPSGNYDCCIYPFDEFYHNVHDYWDEPMEKNQIIIFSSLYSKNYRMNASYIEKQVITFNPTNFKAE